MHTRLVMLTAGWLAVSGCVSEVTLQPGEQTYLLAEPAVLVLPAGGSTTTTIKAFDGATNDPTDVSWSVGQLDAGIRVRVDSTFGTVYSGNHLGLPAKSPSRRFVVTLTGTTAGHFVVSGDAGIVTIQVNPAVPTP